MDTNTFNKIVDERLNECVNVLCQKADEYATADRLHNFKSAASLMKCTPIGALGGMMVNHTVSVYDLIREHEAGVAISQEMWAEKIGDSINYLLLLTALIEEENQLEEENEKSRIRKGEN